MRPTRRRLGASLRSRSTRQRPTRWPCGSPGRQTLNARHARRRKRVRRSSCATAWRSQCEGPRRATHAPSVRAQCRRLLRRHGKRACARTAAEAAPRPRSGRIRRIRGAYDVLSASWAQVAKRIAFP
jgi:hypothetical protein